MTDPSQNSTGFIGSSLFKVMIAVLFLSFGAYALFYYYNKKDAERVAEEVVEESTTNDEPAAAEVEVGAGSIDLPIIESNTTYEYRETENTYTLMDEGGPGPYEFTCGMAATIKTSTMLSPQGAASYSGANMTDMLESTAWSEGRDGLGLGEWVEFTLTDEYKKWYPTVENFIENTIHGGFVIQTGYAKSPAAWKKNSRPVKLKVYLNDEPISIIQLRDTPDFQSFSIFPEARDENSVRLKVGDKIRFEIIDVSRGSSTKDTDALISEFHIEGSCG